MVAALWRRSRHTKPEELARVQPGELRWKCGKTRGSFMESLLHTMCLSTFLAWIHLGTLAAVTATTYLAFPVTLTASSMNSRVEQSRTQRWRSASSTTASDKQNGLWQQPGRGCPRQPRVCLCCGQPGHCTQRCKSPVPIKQWFWNHSYWGWIH